MLSNLRTVGMAAEDGPRLNVRSVPLGCMHHPPRHRRWPHRGRSLLLANPPQAGTSGTNSPLHAFGEERVQNFHVATHFETARSGLVDVKRRAVGIRVSAKEMRGTLNSACNSFVPVSENRA